MIDVIGTIYTQPPVGATGEFLTPPVAVKGFHVNSSEVVEGWDIHRVEPKTPSRVFFGGTTVCYAFESQEAYELALNVTNVTSG
jgi:hypothetical protein